MRLLKSLVSFAFPVIILLITFCVYLLVTKVVNNYKQNIVNDYAIVIISNTPTVSIDEVAGIGVKDIKVINRDKIINDIKDNLSKSSLELLNNKLPYFYKIYLQQFPTTSKLVDIRKELLSLSNIKKVEIFSNDHNKIYSLLILIQDIVSILFIVVLLSSFLIILKQVKIWFFEHSQRISIIQLHGGSLFYGSKPILNIMIISIIISVVVVVGFVFFIMKNISLMVQPEILPLMPKTYDLYFELFQIIVLAIIVPAITFFGLLIKYKIKNNV